MFLVIDARRCYDKTVENSDTSDGRNLMPEPSINADPAVTAEDSESSQTTDTIDSASTSTGKTSKELADPVTKLAVPFQNGADPVEQFVTALLFCGKLPEPQA